MEIVFFLSMKHLTYALEEGWRHLLVGEEIPLREDFVLLGEDLHLPYFLALLDGKRKRYPADKDTALRFLGGIIG